jgi:NADPH:quinone reductase-like Zn-dependent oxidoreductase
MRVIELQDSFGLDRLRIAKRTLPEPEPGEVRVRVDAVSLNYRDLLMVQGNYNPRQPLPLIPCSDGVGRVEALGAGTETLAIGDRVIGCFAPGWQDGPLTAAGCDPSLRGADRLVGSGHPRRNSTRGPGAAARDRRCLPLRATARQVIGGRGADHIKR